MGESRLVPFPTAQQVSLPPCSSHSPFIAERQAGKLWIPMLKSLVWPDSESNLPKSTASKADALTTRPSELLFLNLLPHCYNIRASLHKMWLSPDLGHGDVKESIFHRVWAPTIFIGCFVEHHAIAPHVIAIWGWRRPPILYRSLCRFTHKKSILFWVNPLKWALNCSKLVFLRGIHVFLVLFHWQKRFHVQQKPISL